MNKEKGISVIMPCWNSEGTIKDAIESIALQDMMKLPYEIIVVDDCSEDASTNIVKALMNDIASLHLFENDKNQGVAYCRNVGMSRAKYRFLAFCDSDDRWLKGKIKWQLGLLENSEQGVSHTSFNFINQWGKKIGHFKAKPSVLFGNNLMGNSVQMSSLVLDLDKVRAPNFRPIGHEDLLFIMTLLGQSESRAPDGDFLDYRIHPGSLSQNKITALRWYWRIIRVELGFPRWLCSIFAFAYVIAGLKKHSFRLRGWCRNHFRDFENG